MLINLYRFNIISVPPLTIVGGEHHAFGLSVRPSVRPSVCCPLYHLLRVTRYLRRHWRDLNEIKHSIHYMSGHC